VGKGVLGLVESFFHCFASTFSSPKAYPYFFESAYSLFFLHYFFFFSSSFFVSSSFFFFSFTHSRLYRQRLDFYTSTEKDLPTFAYVCGFCFFLTTDNN